MSILSGFTEQKGRESGGGELRITHYPLPIPKYQILTVNCQLSTVRLAS
jgi:hypothetical protein